MIDEAGFIASLVKVLGGVNVLTDPKEVAPYLLDPRGMFSGCALAVVKPKSRDEVSSIVRFANEARISIVPQGGNTGLVGGQIPDHSSRQLVVSLERLNDIQEIDLRTNTMTVGAGALLRDVHTAANAVDRLFPLSLPAALNCTIGGNIASNAGGNMVVSYGNIRELVAGLEVVLPDGKIWSGLNKLGRNSARFDAKQLFIGTEGILGIITAAVLRLSIAPANTITAICALSSPSMALRLFELLHAELGQSLVVFELIPRFGLELVLRHFPEVQNPIEGKYPWYVLLETMDRAMSDFGSAFEDVGYKSSFHHALKACLRSAGSLGIVSDVVMADKSADRSSFWDIRKLLPSAQKLEGASIKHDVLVPVFNVPLLISDVCEAARNILPGVRPLPFGHFGAGNIHFNFTKPECIDGLSFLEYRPSLTNMLYSFVLKLGGSVIAEHGVGRLKVELLRSVSDSVELGLLEAIKGAIDPDRLVNPGKVL